MNLRPRPTLTCLANELEETVVATAHVSESHTHTDGQTYLSIGIGTPCQRGEFRIFITLNETRHHGFLRGASLFATARHGASGSEVVLVRDATEPTAPVERGTDNGSTMSM